MIKACITEAELRKALKDIEEAKARGFEYSLAVLKLAEAGETLSDDVLVYGGSVILKADPEDPSKNWGHCSTKQIEWYKLVDGDVIVT